jgi:hypothetical protein
MYFPLGTHHNSQVGYIDLLRLCFAVVVWLQSLWETFGVVVAILCAYGFQIAKRTSKTRSVCHTVPLPVTLKSTLMQKKTYENSNISPCKDIIFFKNPLKVIKILQHIITL